MYCRNCGAELNENAIVCSQCGQMQNAPYEEPQSTPFADPMQDEKREELSKNAFVWGLLSLIFAIKVPPLGFIFSFIAKRRVKEYTNLFGKITGRARIGSIFAKVGFIIGLVQIIIFVLVISLDIFEHVLELVV